MRKLERNFKCFKIQDKDKIVQIKQPSIDELTSLYYVLLKNLNNINKFTVSTKIDENHVLDTKSSFSVDN